MGGLWEGPGSVVFIFARGPDSWVLGPAWGLVGGEGDESFREKGGGLELGADSWVLS